jgi:hypothetical protein
MINIEKMEKWMKLNKKLEDIFRRKENYRKIFLKVKTGNL